MAKDDTGRRIKAVRRLVRSTAPHNAKARLAKIAEIASGGGDLDGVFKAPRMPTDEESLAGKKASQSRITDSHAKTEAEKKRKSRGTRDRIMKTGIDRGET